MKSLVTVADFSIAPNLAFDLANRLPPKSSLLAAFRSRLLQSFDEKLPWKLDSSLLTWLLAKAPRASSLTRVDAVQRWLADHLAATNVRAQYLSFLLQLPKEKQFDGLRRQAAINTAQWLADHPADTNVRTQYVSFVLNLSSDGMDELRRNSERHHRFLIEKNPRYFAPYYTYGELLLRLERYPEAADQFREVLKRHKGHQLAHRGLAIALHKLGQFDDAENEFDHAIWWAGQNKMPQAMFFTSLGWFYIERSRWSDAIDALRQAQSESPDYFGNHWGIGWAMKELGNYGEAEKSLRKALETPDLETPARDEIPRLLEEVLRQQDREHSNGF